MTWSQVLGFNIQVEPLGCLSFVARVLHKLTLCLFVLPYYPFIIFFPSVNLDARFSVPYGLDCYSWELYLADGAYGVQNLEGNIEGADALINPDPMIVHFTFLILAGAL